MFVLNIQYDLLWITLFLMVWYNLVYCCLTVFQQKQAISYHIAVNDTWTLKLSL